MLGQQVRHLAGPDDDDVLDVRGVPPSEDARDRAEQRNQDDRDPPEDHEAREVRMREADDLGDRDEPPRPDRHHLEDAEDVVDRRVIRPLLVPVVEPVHPCEEHPERQACDEERDLPAHADDVDDRSGRDEGEREKERANEPDEIGDEEQASHEPAPPPHRAWEHGDLRDDPALARGDCDAIPRWCSQMNPPLHARLPALRNHQVP